MLFTKLLFGFVATTTAFASLLNLSKRGVLESTNYTAIEGFEELYPRLPIQVLQNEHPDVFNIFILGLRKWMATPEEDDNSYYRIAGIHGVPYVPWQGQGVAGTKIPYCSHSSILFLTWHRPYLILIEKQVASHSEKASWDFPKEQRDRWLEAAKQVRLPYWDWAAPGGESIPAILSAFNITVETPDGSKTIENPLSVYHFQRKDLLDEFFKPEGFEIYNSTWRTEEEGNKILARQYPARRDDTYAAFSLHNFNRFSTNSFNKSFVSNLKSIETIHNNVHIAVGGHMGRPEFSSFDPIFWLHHAQVDRLMAIYQAIYPESILGAQAFVEPNLNPRGTLGYGNVSMVETVDTPLWPFRISKDKLFTSRNFSYATDIFEYGYYYPEVIPKFTYDEKGLIEYTTDQLKRVYGPFGGSKTHRFSGIRHEWYASVIFDSAEILDHFTISLYLSATPPDSPVDSSIFNGVSQWSLHSGPAGTNLIGGSASLTSNLEARDLNLIDRKITGEYLSKNLGWRIFGNAGEIIPTEMLSSLEISVYVEEVEHFSGPKLPKHGVPELIREATEGKLGGLKNRESRYIS